MRIVSVVFAFLMTVLTLAAPAAQLCASHCQLNKASKASVQAEKACHSEDIKVLKSKKTNCCSMGVCLSKSETELETLFLVPEASELKAPLLTLVNIESVVFTKTLIVVTGLQSRVYLASKVPLYLLFSTLKIPSIVIS